MKKVVHHNDAESNPPKPLPGHSPPIFDPLDQKFGCADRLRMVRMRGLEPPRLATPEPKSGTSTNSVTSAQVDGRI